VMRGIMTRIIDSQPDMKLVGVASDPVVAMERLRTCNPDVIALDVEMPRMNGLQFLSRLMQSRPLPVVMVSSLTQRGAETTLRALELGAVDFVAKPKVNVAGSLVDYSEEIIEKVKTAARARVKSFVASHSNTHRDIVAQKFSADAILPPM